MGRGGLGNRRKREGSNGEYTLRLSKEARGMGKWGRQRKVFQHMYQGFAMGGWGGGGRERHTSMYPDLPGGPVRW